MQAARLFACLVLVSALTPVGGQAAKEAPSSKKPILVVPGQRLLVSTTAGWGVIPLYTTIRARVADLGTTYPLVKHAVIVIHGSRRNAAGYNNIGEYTILDSGQENWNTLLITPEFLEQIDAAVNQLPDDDLRWKHEAWIAGENAHNAPISSFDALDAILERLSNHILLPNLQSVVLMGYGAGGQMVQRYAVAGRGGDALVHSGIRLRYVIVNPSSYLYFSPERPTPGASGGFDFIVPPRECSSDNNRWKYGIDDPPPYAANADFAALEERYIHRDVVYLLGTDDIDPNESSLDTSCAGENEGPDRFFRGKAYFRYLELRHPELATEPASQQLWYVPGVGNDTYKMLSSPCGLAALFNTGDCATRILFPKP
ncbi:MAG: hypothetical protein ABSD72_01770 [Terracidiphilus sp.]|jgi:hypothetical protein